MTYSDFAIEMLKIKEERRKSEKALERKRKRLSIPITELKKYYTIVLWYNFGYESKNNFRTKKEALKYMSTQLKYLKKDEYFEDITKFTLSVTKNGESEAVSTHYDIVNL